MTPLDLWGSEGDNSRLKGSISSLNGQLDSPSTFILGGSNVSRGEYEENAAIFLLDDQKMIIGLCGGTLIASNKILTAAHCAQQHASRYLVLTNFFSFGDRVSASDFHSLESVAAHPRFNSRTLDYDIAVLTLSTHVQTKAAKLYGGSSSLQGETAVSIGSGLTSTRPERSANIVQKVNTTIFSNAECNLNWRALRGVAPITDRMLCAGSLNNNNGTCSGDSGSGLYREFNGQRLVVAAVSFGLSVCERNRGNQAYARVSALLDFITKHSPETVVVDPDVEPKRAKPEDYMPIIIQFLLEDDEIPEVLIKG